ncbi:hypothetical protein BASA83_005929 [Batrachochytrium salamandrivorans]|nr:hypothetical protein BASA83_005929 [Batrachochytrium salamandrivorans]
MMTSPECLDTSRAIHEWEEMHAADYEAMQDCSMSDSNEGPTATQQSGITELFQSKPVRGSAASALFFACDDEDCDDMDGAQGDAQTHAVSTSNNAVASGYTGHIATTHPSDDHQIERHCSYAFQSSPPTFTSPSFRTDQPVPIPSNLDIDRSCLLSDTDPLYDLHNDTDLTPATAYSLGESQFTNTMGSLDKVSDLTHSTAMALNAPETAPSAQTSPLFLDMDDDDDDEEELFRHAQQHQKTHNRSRLASLVDRDSPSIQNTTEKSAATNSHSTGSKRPYVGLSFDSSDNEENNENEDINPFRVNESIPPHQKIRHMEYNYSALSCTNDTAQSFRFSQEDTAESTDTIGDGMIPAENTGVTSRFNQTSEAVFRPTDVANDTTTTGTLATDALATLVAGVKNVTSTGLNGRPVFSTSPGFSNGSTSKGIVHNKRDKEAEMDDALRMAAQEVMANMTPKVAANVKRTEIVEPAFLKRPHGKPFISAVSSSGVCFYFPKRSTELLGGAHSNEMLRLGTTKAGLDARDKFSQQEYLSTPIHRLMEQVQGIRTQQRINKLLEAEQSNQSIAQTHPVMVAKSATGKSVDTLWVDKYRPRMYVDMVGDERLNREVLTWVKQWDYCVFGKPVKRTLENMNQSKFRKKSLFENNKPADKLKRPERRILLLAGPPGLGKTTLAHVVAHHAGYNIVEINASDDRTGEALKNKVISAIESQSVFSDKRPNLVIIDEIDGASSSGSGDQTFIKMLVRLVEANDNSHAKEDGGMATVESDSAPKKRKQKSQRSLMRPIICICNDQYAQVLRPLHEIAQVFTFREPPLQALSKRLYEICRWEGLRADLRAVKALCEMTRGDMRSAINTLQFVRRKTGHLTKEMLLELDIGHKDFSKGLFDVWKRLFGRPNAKELKSIQYLIRDGKDDNGVLKHAESDRYINRIVPILQHAGDYDKIMQGCFENYLQTTRFDLLRSTSTKRSRLDEISDTTYMFDQIEMRIARHQQFELMAYQPFLLVDFYRLFASEEGRQIQLTYPRAEYKMFVERKESEGILRALIGGYNAGAMRQVSAVRLELVSLLVAIVSPEFRPLNFQSLKSNERDMLNRLVSVMSSFGMRLTPKTKPNGLMSFELDPPIHSVLMGEAGRVPTINDMSNTIKQMISHEINLANMRRKDAAMLAAQAHIAQATSTQKKKSDIKEAAQQKKDLANMNRSNGVMRPPVIAAEAQLPRDFFGRLIETKAVMEDDPSDKKNLRLGSGVKISYKFNEGFSNAVRTTVYVKDFL